MSKSFIDVVKDSSRTGLGTPVETEKPLEPYFRSRDCFSALNFTNG